MKALKRLKPACPPNDFGLIFPISRNFKKCFWNGFHIFLLIAALWKAFLVKTKIKRVYKAKTL